jgi:alpha-ketoglutarate-dependent taurine dioxygenase
MNEIAGRAPVPSSANAEVPAMLQAAITGTSAWKASDLSPADWTIRLDDAALAELRAVLASLRHSPVEMFLIDPADYHLEACRAVMARVREQLRHGIRFAVLDRLPLDEMSRDEATKLYWLLSSLIARPVAQKLNGQMLFDVRDTGAKMKPGSGIRPTVTNVDLTYHNDNSYNDTPPDYVCLLCLQTAREGGVSRVVSVDTVHNTLLAEHPDLLERLYRPVFYDRHAEHGASEDNVFQASVFEYSGTLKARLALSEIRGGYALRGAEIDPPTQAALTAVQDVFNRPDLRVELDFQPGQIQFVNNRATGHARTEFHDHDEPDRRRHLVRLWLREAGTRGYRG